MNTPTVTVIGAGLAGCECAWQLAKRGVRVRLRLLRRKNKEGSLVRNVPR